jgi:hypothetical protein
MLKDGGEVVGPKRTPPLPKDSSHHNFVHISVPLSNTFEGV